MTSTTASRSGIVKLACNRRKENIIAKSRRSTLKRKKGIVPSGETGRELKIHLVAFQISNTDIQNNASLTVFRYYTLMPHSPQL